jgi:hypothetical protein
MQSTPGHASAGDAMIPASDSQVAAERSHQRRSRWARIASRHWPVVVALVLGTLIGAAGLAGFQAYGAVPPPPLGGNLAVAADSDLVLTIREQYLSRIAAQQVASVPSLVPFENVRVNILPGDRLRATGDIPFMGQRFQASAMMSVGVAERKIKLQVQEVMLGTLLLPIDLDAIFAQPINRELAQIIEDGQFDVLHVGTASDRLVLHLASRSAAAPR